MNDKIIDYHPIKGYITFNDLINDMEIIYQDYKCLEKIIIDILSYQNYDEETINSLLDNSIDTRLENIIYVLKDRL